MIRLAGHGRLADGSLVTWTVAEGRRGRRWREVVERDGSVRWSLLYETGPDRRFTHLELATAGALATLHPEGDGTLHGNVVDADGVRHIEGVAFPAGTMLHVAGSAMAGAALAWAGARAGSAAVVLEPDGSRLDARALTDEDLPSIDAQGIVQLTDAAVWPLESPEGP